MPRTMVTWKNSGARSSVVRLVRFCHTPKVPGAPRHLPAEAHQATRDAAGCQRLLARMHVGQQVNLHAAGQVETAPDGSVDHGDFFQADHAFTPPASNIFEPVQILHVAGGKMSTDI